MAVEREISSTGRLLHAAAFEFFPQPLLLGGKTLSVEHCSNFVKAIT